MKENSAVSAVKGNRAEKSRRTEEFGVVCNAEKIRTAACYMEKNERDNAFFI
jgi:hypothetical protein